ncbi:hypothetical protein HB364_13785 [Pseudoflavitalea sp. X16]|uniref:hypothetical protein n=1 Tax=Paraflavitalea devenefica TaxID=2716334 RepID=UPI00141FB642|nr:hypothetical protein [Paraflavitalea devenefica]NII26159.1 hypothetical protein [Paraflavitalea devenefica]
MKMCVWAAVCLLGVMITQPTSAQISFNWNEWFRQKKTEKRYLAQHIAQLQVYLQLVKEGYQVIDKGAKFIHQARNGELTLHDLFYLSLKMVNQRIKNYPAVSKTIDHHSFIARKSQDLLNRIDQSEFLRADQKEYVHQTMGRLRSDMSASLDELVTVLSDYALEMEDHERIKRIERLEAYALERVLFMKSYYGHVLAMVGQRMNETVDISVLGNHYGMP